MKEHQNPYGGSEPPQNRKSSKAWVWVLILALVVPMFLCAGLCGGLMLFRVRSVEMAENHAQRAMHEAAQAAAQAANEVAQPAPPFQQAMQRVQSDMDVKQRLGEPIRQTGPSTFRSEKSADEASAELSFELKGPRGKASVHGVAAEIDDRWWFETLDVTFPDGETIDLADVEIPIKL